MPKLLKQHYSALNQRLDICKSMLLAVIILIAVVNPLVVNSKSSITRDGEQNPSVNLDDVYQIEVIAFSHRYQESGEQQQWQASPALHYPDKLIFLRNFLEPVQKNEIGPLDEITANGKSSLFPVENPSAKNLATKNANSVNNVRDSETSLELDKNITTLRTMTNQTQFQNHETPQQEQEISMPLAPELMLSLDKEKMTLGSIAKKLSRQSRYRLLFHKSWHQELESKKTAPAMPLSGGTLYDDHHELEGTIRISKDRFLHITAHLWLTDFVEKNTLRYESTMDHVDSGGPLPLNTTLPTFPVMPQSFPEDILEREASNLESLIAASKHNSIAEPHIKQHATTRPIKGNVFTTSTYSHNKFANNNPESHFTEPNLYQIKSIVELKEYRKMRRNKIHYLDHPLFGVIIKITKYEVDTNDAVREKN